MTDLLGQLRSPHECKQFWNALGLPRPHLPAQLRSPLAWTQPMREALNPPDPSIPLQPGIMEGSPPSADGAALSVSITRDEVVSALCTLRGKL